MAVLLGKHTCYEFANSGPCYDLPWPPARNPWDTDHVAGRDRAAARALRWRRGMAMGAIGSRYGADRSAARRACAASSASSPPTGG